MTDELSNEEAIKAIDETKRKTDVFDDLYLALDMAIKALELVEAFKRANIITGGRLNGRVYAYKCGLADGERMAKGESPYDLLLDTFAKRGEKDDNR